MSTLKSQKARAKKYGAVLTYGPADLLRIVNPECRYCGKKLTPATVNFDHMVPVSRGGSWTLENLAAICAADNRRKGELTHDEYELVLAALRGFNNEFLTRDVLRRLSAGAAFIHG